MNPHQRWMLLSSREGFTNGEGRPEVAHEDRGWDAGFRRPAYRVQHARALHQMRQAAGGLRRRGPSEEEFEG
jgi:hypothetical protein